jgi:hypothetical protein
VRDSSGGGGANDYPVTNAAVFTTGVWLHLAAVYDGGNRTFRFYTNGVQATVVSLDTAPPANLTGSHLGAWLGFDENLHRFLDGQIDEVAVYATALPPARIAAHYWSAIPNELFSTQGGTELRFEWIIPGVVLQQNTNLANPSGWTDVPGATNSPFVVPFSSAQKFFRLKKY